MCVVLNICVISNCPGTIHFIFPASAHQNMTEIHSVHRLFDKIKKCLKHFNVKYEDVKIYMNLIVPYPYPYFMTVLTFKIKARRGAMPTCVVKLHCSCLLLSWHPLLCILK